MTILTGVITKDVSQLYGLTKTGVVFGTVLTLAPLQLADGELAEVAPLLCLDTTAAAAGADGEPARAPQAVPGGSASRPAAGSAGKAVGVGEWRVLSLQVHPFH
jgi:hypothetical protein